MTTFSNGDTVKMKSGGPPMTVVRIIGASREDQFVFIDTHGYEAGDVICEWFDGNRRKSDVFKKSSLLLIDMDQLMPFK